MKRGWVFGPIPDLLLGCGVGYLLLAVGASLSSLDRTMLLVWGGVLTLFTGMPHYGATLLRVYEQREDRRRYAFFAVWVSLVVWALFVWGVYDRFVGSLFLTLYLTWSPWHYSGQNYGLTVMFLRRAGAELDAGTKRLLYATFLLSYGLAFLTLHGDPNGPEYGPVVLGGSYRFVRIPIARAFYSNTFQVVLGSYLAALVMVAWRLRSNGRALIPAASLVATQAAWFSIPSAFVAFTGYSLAAVDVAFLFVWVAVGHATQYLWITTYYAVGSKGGRLRGRYLGKTLLAGAIVWTIPPLIFSPALLGTTTYGLGLFMLVSSAVNLQHFVLDGAIWKLRDGRVARALLAKVTADRPTPVGVGSRRSLGRAAFLVVGSVSTLVAIMGVGLRDLAWPHAVAAGESGWAGRIEEWLSWLGRDEPGYWNRRARERFMLGDVATSMDLYDRSLALFPNAEAWEGIAELRLARGKVTGALDALHQSIAIRPTAQAWSSVGVIEAQRRNFAEAGEAFERSIKFAPPDPVVLQRYGRFWLDRSDPARALPALERAAALDPTLRGLEADLARARR